MITIYFKNVGQGDSIILEWERDRKKCIGIIDCNLINDTNPTLEFLISNNVSEIEFIILSHFHYDHYSGMASVFEHCMKNKIKVKYFFHSLAPFVSEILNRILNSQKIQKSIKDFFETYQNFSDFIEDSIQITRHLKDLNLNETISLSFLTPDGRVYDKMQLQLARKVNQITTTSADINKLSTIIKIYNQEEAILLTSDSVKKNFVQLRNKITHEITLVQAPHHGSSASIDKQFWDSIKKIDKCPAVFSVGDEPKDKLPNRESVEFFANQGFDIYSTNNVYGIRDYFGYLPTITNPKTTILNNFSKLRATTTSKLSSAKFNGTHKFDLLK